MPAADTDVLALTGRATSSGCNQGARSPTIRVVPAHFFKLSKRLIKACPADWILTPNERLAREFNLAYGAHQIEQGKTAWVTPRAASVNRFLHSCAEQVLPLGDRPSLLSREAELLLWQELGDQESEPLCELAAEAWQLLHAYRIPLDDTAFAGTMNSRMFRRWARRFRERLRQEGLITGAELADAVPGDAERLHLVAFDRVTPQFADLLRRIERAGGTVRHHRPGAMRNGPRKRVETANRAVEIHAAAQWARHVLTRYPNARIGIVFPYLTDAYFAIAHAFEAEFADTVDAFNISGGVPLAEQPIWRDAELILRLAVGDIGHSELERLQRSPWLRLGTPLRMPIASLERLRLRQLRGASGVFRELESRARQWPVRQPFGRWVDAFRALLAAAGWDGSSALSVQYQAHRQLSESLALFCRLPQLPNLTGADALQTLQRHLSKRPFGPERPPAPVQVLGYLETTGLIFSHLWVAGLQDTAWPAAPSPNPLLPIPLQRLHGVPRTDHPAEAEFALEQMQRWRRASRYMVVSHAADEGDEQHRCSGLVESIPLASIEKLVPRFRTRRHPWLAEPPEGVLQPMLDERATPLRETPARGGTSLLRDQAQCPFRAWAVHRLGLREVREPQHYPDALERGILVHDSLFALYDGGAGPDVEASIEQAVSTALDKHLREAPEAYREHERIRLRVLLGKWVDLEAERPEFVVVGLEQEARLALPGLELSLRIDRIDRDPQTGARAVIDYKTGNATASRLLDERLTEPQLPIYALTDTAIRSTLYAQLGTDRISLKGLASEEIELGKGAVHKLPAADWDALTVRWRAQVEALAKEFLDGHAAVQPSSPGVCANCHLPSFCRIHAAARTPQEHPTIDTTLGGRAE